MTCVVISVIILPQFVYPTFVNGVFLIHIINPTPHMLPFSKKTSTENKKALTATANLSGAIHLHMGD